MENLTFTLTLEEANLIMASLGKQPYDAVFPLVTKLQEQAKPQLAKLKTQKVEEVVEEVAE